MRLFEVIQSPFDPLLVEFWKQCSPQILNLYFKQNNCYTASLDFAVFLETKGIGFAEVIKIGRFVNDVKKFGWFETDIPDYHYDALTVTDRKVMTSQQLNPRNARDRANYINSSPELIAEFCWIPHSWVEVRGVIYDPSGFYINGISGQFDKLVKDKSNLADRYHYYK